jgi:HD-GYP domain-containing protein (c-di-GMP phosphodiesterase class II)
MFRRKAPEPSESFDFLRASQELLSARTLKVMLEAALGSALQLAPAATKAWAVLRQQGTDRVSAVRGYGSEFLNLELVGPWVDNMPKISTNLAGDLFNPNLPDVRAKLGAMGLREAKQAIFIPLKDRGQGLRGAIVVDSYGDAFPPSALEALTRWGAVVTGALGTFLEMSVAKSLAWNLTLTFIEAIEAQDFTQLGHAVRVTSYAMAMARELNLTPPEQNDLWFTAMLHDIGKLGGSNFDDVAIAGMGYNLLERVAELETPRAGILHLMEHWDGSGGPKGLKGNAIPLFSRLVAVSNAFDNLTSERGDELSNNEALEQIRAGSGTLYDPEVVLKLEAVLKQNKATAELRQGSLFPVV